MKIKNQQKIWNKIAPEWFEFRDKPLKEVIFFLKKQKSLSKLGQTEGRILDLGGGQEGIC